MPLQKLQFKPGINRDLTAYANEGGWYDGNRIRFRQGYPEKIGGWQKFSNSRFGGSCRALYPWATLSLDKYIAVGTHLKYYISSGGSMSDVTPIRRTASAGDVTFSAVDGSSALTVTDADHGAYPNDFVTYSDAESLGGNITADVLNQEYQIVLVLDADSYTIQARTAGTPVSEYINDKGQFDFSSAAILADSSDTGDGGTSTVGAYQINTGLDTSVFASGWGAGTWSGVDVGGTDTGWGSAANVNIQAGTLRLWQQDNFGEDLIFNVYNGGIYYLDSSAGISTPGVALEDLAGASNAPVVARKVLVSDVDRHVIAFACNPQGSSVQDPLLIRFSSQEDVTDWNIASSTNTAGELRLGSGTEIITAVETRQQVLVFTDSSLHSLQYIGAPFTFGINQISENITLRGPNAAIAVEDSVYWMGQNEFYIYDGTVRPLQCSVKEYVFSNLNLNQTEKVHTALNTAFGEIWWFYPSNSDNIDSYVVYNYEQGVWYYGTMVRTAWADRSVFDYPIATCNCGNLYYHEIGFDDGGTNPPSPLNAYIESSPMDISDGYQFSFVSRIIPDVTFRNSSNGSASVTMTLKGKDFSGGDVEQMVDAPVTKLVSSSVERYTDKVDVRLRARSISLRVESDSAGTTWRLGNPRIDIRTDGRR